MKKKLKDRNKEIMIYELTALVKIKRWNHVKTDVFSPKELIPNSWNAPPPSENKDGFVDVLNGREEDTKCDSYRLIDWSERSLQTRARINRFFKANKRQVFKELKQWFLVDDKHKFKAKILKLVLKLSRAYFPVVFAQLEYKTTTKPPVSTQSIESEIALDFEHWENAGDKSFEIAALFWQNKQNDEDEEEEEDDEEEEEDEEE